MTAKAATLTQLIIDSVWKLATGWTLPGLSFNFATFMLGIIIIGVVIAMFNDFLIQFGVKPFDTNSGISAESQAKAERDYYDAVDRYYNEQLRGYYDRRK